VTEKDAPDAARLCQEILAEGQRAAAALREEARRQGEAILARARLEAEAVRGEAARAAQREGGRRAERLLAGVAIEVLRRRAAAVEALLESVRERARRELLGGAVSRDALASMAAHALARMAGEAFVLGVRPGELARLGDGLAGEVLRRAGRGPARLTASEDPSMTGPGFVLCDVEGHQRWDGQLGARLDRLWPALRAAVAEGLGVLEKGERPP
jgi:vacuolar-type H+-ATPase subunit E/Vma4